MSVVDDLLQQLRETSEAAPEVDPGRPRQASSDGGGAKCSTPEALEAPGIVGTGTDGVKAPVLFTQVARCDDCQWTCCEVDGTCWQAERDEIARLREAGEYDSAPYAYAAPWSKRAIRDELTRREREVLARERRRQEKEEQIKAERKAARDKKKGTAPIPGTNGRPQTPTERLAETPIHTETNDKFAAARERGTEAMRKTGRGSRPGVKGQPPKMSVAQVEAAVQEQEFRSIRAIANERWQEWGYGSPAAAYQGVRGQIKRLGLPLLDGRRLGDGPRAREAKKEAA